MLDPRTNYRIHRRSCGSRGFCDCGSYKLGRVGKIWRIVSYRWAS